jgi:Ser/Thr protein kinase RdoA (MazF antagonist)
MVTDVLLDIAAKYYDIDKNTIHFISDSTNQIYCFIKNGKHFILRFSNRPADKIKEVKAEMEWLYYLASNNIGVGLPLETNTGELVVSVQDNGGNFIISSFGFVPGEFWDKNNPRKWNERIFFNWGKVMGDIHRLSKGFTFSNDEITRVVFDGRFALDDSIKDCPTVNEIAEELIKQMMSLPKNKDCYGLIHNDMHQWNFYIDGDDVNVFDFDDSLYGWFALDMGIALYHALWWGRKDDAGNDYTDAIITNFLKGYLAANALSDYWIAQIPLFMKFRQICKFSWFYDSNNVDEHQKERIKNIETGILFTDCKIEPSVFRINKNGGQ